MAHRFDVEAVDQMLQDVRGCDRPFGGVTFLAGGDFRQVAPVVPGANAALLTAASVRKSPLWPQFTLSELTWPLRDRQDPHTHVLSTSSALGILVLFRKLHSINWSTFLQRSMLLPIFQRP